MTTVASVPLDIRLTVPHGPAYEGEWVPLLLTLTRPSDAGSSVQVRAITCTDADVQLDLDLLDRETPVRPGETYRVTVPLRVRQPKVIGLGHISVHVRETEGQPEEPVRLPASALAVRPAIARHIAVKLEPLCVYDDGTKVLLTLRHTGSKEFRNLTINLLPPEAIRGGKPTIQRPVFVSAEEEQLELVVAGQELDVVVTADVDGERTESRQTLAIEKPSPPEGRRFRFLEPRRLSTDVITMSERSGEAATAVDSREGVYSVHGGNRYELVIRPQHPGTTAIAVRDIPGIIHVRDSQSSNDGSWRFLIDVSFADLLRKPEVIYYDVKSRGEHLTGEVPICLTPPWLRHWQVAAALGLALTVQGAAAIGRFLHTADFDLTSIAAEFDLRQDYNLFFLFSVPAALGLIKVVDWVQYRWGQ